MFLQAAHELRLLFNAWRMEGLSKCACTLRILRTGIAYNHGIRAVWIRVVLKPLPHGHRKTLVE